MGLQPVGADALNGCLPVRLNACGGGNDRRRESLCGDGDRLAGTVAELAFQGGGGVGFCHAADFHSPTVVPRGMLF